MGAGVELRLFMIIVGLVFWVMTNISLAKRHMTESFCIFWGIISVLFILAGIILQPAQWNKYISWSGMLLILFGVLLLLSGAFYFSLRVSRLTREVRELAIQVSLLNQEIETILRELTKDQTEIERRADEEEALVRN